MMRMMRMMMVMVMGVMMLLMVVIMKQVATAACGGQIGAKPPLTPRRECIQLVR